MNLKHYTGYTYSMYFKTVKFQIMILYECQNVNRALTTNNPFFYIGIKKGLLTHSLHLTVDCAV